MLHLILFHILEGHMEDSPIAFTSNLPIIIITRIIIFYLLFGLLYVRAAQTPHWSFQLLL